MVVAERLLPTRAQRVSAPAFFALVAVNVLIVAAVVGDVGIPLLALVGIAPLAWLLSQRPQRGLLALVALVPFDGLLDLVPHPSIIAGWKEALAIALVLATFVCPTEARAEGKVVWPSWWPALAGLIAFSVATVVLFRPAAGTLGLKIAFFYVLGYVAVRRCPLSARERDRLVTILMATGVITALYGVLQQVVGATRLHDLGYEYNTAIRFSGSLLRSFSTFEQPFPFGFFMMVVLLVCIPVALEEPNRARNRWFLLVGVPLLGLGLLSSIVRGAWLGLAVGVAYLGTQRYRVLLLALPLGFAALLLIPPEIANRALSSSSTTERVAGWSENLNQLVSHPFGSGAGSSGAAAQTDEIKASGETDVGALRITAYQPDNYYFLTAYQLGPIGVWLLLLLLAAVLSSSRRASRVLTGRDGALAAGTTAMVVGALAASLVATYFEIFPMDVLWWLLIGVVDSAVVTAAVAPAPSSGPPTVRRASTVVPRWTSPST